MGPRLIKYEMKIYSKKLTKEDIINAFKKYFSRDEREFEMLLGHDSAFVVTPYFNYSAVIYIDEGDSFMDPDSGSEGKCFEVKASVYVINSYAVYMFVRDVHNVINMLREKDSELDASERIEDEVEHLAYLIKPEV